MADLRICEACERHFRATEEACPFCAVSATAGATAKKAVTVGVMAAFGVALAACYGGPTRDDNMRRLNRDTAGPDGASTQPIPPSAPASGSVSPKEP